MAYHSQIWDNLAVDNITISMDGVETSSRDLPSLHPGAVLAERFRLVEPLGRGGMAVVWKARDTLADHDVALKIFPRNNLSPSQQERILRELKAGRELSHPNLVRYYEIHETADHLLLSMEIVEGPTLEAIIREAGVSPPLIHSLLSGVTACLEYLHERGVIHRDVKPSNIFCLEDGRALLGDLGIIHEEEAATLTRTGDFLGTPEYMAPEIFKDGKALPESDYYSLGITLYEGLAGRLPLEDATFGRIVEWPPRRPPPPLHREVHRRRRAPDGALMS